MDNLALQDKSFEATQSSSSYHLSIQILPYAYSLAVLDKARKKYLVLKNNAFEASVKTESLAEKMATVLKQDEYFQLDYHSASCAVVNQRSTFVPTELFDQEHLWDYFKFNHKVEPKEEEEIIFQKFKQLDAYNLFAVSQQLIKNCREKFSEIRFFHQANPFLDELLKLKNNQKESHIKNPFVGINIHQEFFDIAVADTSKLILYNSFRYASIEDFIYFVMYIYKQMKLDPNEIGALVTGQVSAISPAVEKLEKYIKNVEFAKVNGELSSSYLFNEVNLHPYINLLNLYPCA